MEKLTIYNVRAIENDYASLSEIIEKLSDFRYNSSTLTDKEDTTFLNAIKALCTMQDRLFTEARETTKQFLKIA